MTQYEFLTNKQYKILTVLCHGNGKDEEGKLIPCDLDQLLERVAYETTKASMQFSIRALIKRGMLKKDTEARRGAKRVIYIPTRAAMQVMGFRDPSWIEHEDVSHLDI